eukprot:gene17013-20253_t
MVGITSQSDARLYFRAFTSPYSPFKTIESLKLNISSIRRLLALTGNQIASMSPITKLRCYKTKDMEEYLMRVETLVSIKISDVDSSNILCQYLDNKPLLKSLSFEPTREFTVPATLHKKQTLDSLHIHIPSSKYIDIPLLTSSTNMFSKDTTIRLILKHPLEFTSIPPFFRASMFHDQSNPTKVESLTQALLFTKIKHITISLCDEPDPILANQLEAWVNSRPKHNLFTQRIQDTGLPPALSFKESTCNTYMPLQT